MDEAASKLRLEIDSVPEELDEVQRKIMQLEIEREAIRREQDKDKENALSKDIADLTETRNVLKARWQEEKKLYTSSTKRKRKYRKTQARSRQCRTPRRLW